MRFGVFVPQGWRMDLVGIGDPIAQYEAMTNVAKVADEGGWESIWVYDHFHTVPKPTMESTFECWTITSTLARDTSRVRVGQMVGCNGYRNPALYAKIASTVDVASHGRLDAGIGAGWYEHEWKAYGYQWDETPVRMRKFREAVEIIHAMWTEDQPTYAGEHYSIDKPYNEPKGVQTPHPPLWIGGGGEKVTLKLVARLGDACNVGGDDETITHKLDVLRGHCETVGRDYGELTKSSTITVHLLQDGDDPELATAEARGDMSFEEYGKSFIVGGPDAIAARVEALQAIGIDYVLMYVARAAHEPDAVRHIAREVLPRFA